MAVSITTLNLDTSRDNYVPDLVAIKGDYLARFINATIMANGRKIDIANTAVPTINFKRPDGQAKAYSGTTNADGTVLVPVTQWALEIPGRVKCTISVNDQDTKVSTSVFYIQAQDTPYDGGEISPDDPNHDIIEEILASEQARKEAEKIRVDNENIRIANEKQRIINEDERKTNETGRVDAEAQRVENEKQRVANEDERIAAENERIEAENLRKTTLVAMDKRVEGVEEDLYTETNVKGEHYILDVPEKGRVARVNEIGGKTYKSENLIDSIIPQTTTDSGVTWTQNADGTITANGTATALSASAFIRFKKKLQKGTYTLSCSNGQPLAAGLSFQAYYSVHSPSIRSGDISATFEVIEEETLQGAYAYVEQGTTVNNVTFYPMLNGGSEALLFETPFEGLRDIKCTEVKPLPVNFFDISKIKTTGSGMDSLTNNGDGTLTVRPSSNGDYMSPVDTQVTFKEICPDIVPNKRYYLNFTTSGQKYIAFRDLTKNDVWVSGYTLFITQEHLDSIVFVYGEKAKTETILSNFIISVKDIPYTPHIELPSLPIPAEVRALEGYGVGYDNMDKNQLDLAKGTFKKTCVRKKFVGAPSESWYIQNKYHIATCTSAPLQKIGAYEKDPLYSDIRALFPNDTTRISFELKGDLSYITSESQWIDYLKEHPQEVVYPIRDITETDISQYFPTGIDLPLEGNGSIVFENEYKQPVPVDVDIYSAQDFVTRQEAVESFLGYKRYPLNSDKVTQLDAAEIINQYSNFEGYMIEFLANGEAPHRTVGYGWVASNKDGDQFLIVKDFDGRSTRFDKSGWSEPYVLKSDLGHINYKLQYSPDQMNRTDVDQILLNPDYENKVIFVYGGHDDAGIIEDKLIGIAKKLYKKDSDIPAAYLVFQDWKGSILVFDEYGLIPVEPYLTKEKADGLYTSIARTEEVEKDVGQLDERVDEVELTVFDTTTKDYNSRIVDVPVNSSKKATINRIEGHTEKCENLIKFPYQDMPSGTGSKTINGITWTVNEDGSILVNGTATSDSVFTLRKLSNTDFPLYLNGLSLDGSYTTFVYETIGVSYYLKNGPITTNKVFTDSNFNIRIFSGYVAKNLIFRPMLHKGSAAKPFQKYFEGLRDTPVTEITPIGANLLHFRDKKVDSLTIDNGVMTFTNSKLSFESKPINITQDKVSFLVNIQDSNSTAKADFYFTFADKTSIHTYSTLENKNLVRVLDFKNRQMPCTLTMYVQTQEPYSLTAKFMLVNGEYTESNYPKFTPYIDLPSLPIPAEVQALPGYGKEWTSMDFANFVDDGIDLELTGDEYIAYYKYKEANGIQFSDILDASYSRTEGICSDADVNGIDVNTLWIGINNSYIYWTGILDRLGFTGDAGGVDQFKQYLRERKAAGNPVKIRYKSSVKHEVTPISQYFQGAGLPDVVVEAGGSIEFVNEHNQDMKTNITFTSDTVLLTEDDVDVEATPDKIPRRTNAGEVKGVTTAESGTDILVNKGYAQENFADKGKVELLEKEVDHLKANVLDFVEDDSVAYVKDVPVGASPKALIGEIGGKTYKSENLWTTDVTYPLGNNINYEADTQTYILPTNTGGISRSIYKLPTPIPKGVKLTITAFFETGYATGGSIRFSGYNAVSSPPWLPAPTGLSVPLNTELSGKIVTESATTDSEVTDFWVFAYAPVTITKEIRVKIKISVGEETQPKVWTPHFEGLRDTKCTEVKSMGANLWDGVIKEPNGFYYDDGIFASGNMNYDVYYVPCKPNTEYSRVVTNGVFGGIITYWDKSGNFISGINRGSAKTYTTPEGAYLVKMALEKIQIGKNIMVNRGATPLPYTPYVDLPSLPIPAEVQAFEGYGKSAGEYPNYLDLVNGEAVNRVETYTIDGSEKITVKDLSNAKILVISLKLNKTPQFTGYQRHIVMSCDKFNAVTGDTPYGKINPYEVRHTGYTNDYDFAFPVGMSLEEANAYLKGTTINIFVKEIDKTDISQYFPNGGTINVQGGGSVIFENEHKAPVPSRALYSVNRKPKLTMPQGLKVSGTTASWIAAPNATNYTLFIDNVNLGSIATTTRDLSQLPAWNTISAGQHTLNVIATANDYADSDTAMVIFTK